MVLLLNVDLPGLHEMERFRFYSMMYASHLALTGVARTHSGNQASLMLEGEEDQLGRFIDWYKTQSYMPRMAHYTMLADHVA